MSEQVTLTTCRCSACEQKFTVINIESIDTMECSNCHEKYFKHNGQWHNEKMREYVLSLDKTPVKQAKKKHKNN